MYFYVFLSALLHFANGDQHGVYGENVSISDYPYQAAVYRFSSRYKGFSGGAVIVSKKYLLAAAHCVGGRKNEYSVLIGESYIPNHYDGSFLYGKLYKIAQITIHPEYDSSFYPTNADNDIAVLAVEGSLKLNGITTAAVELSLTRTQAGLISEVSGYGNVSRTNEARPKTVILDEFYRRLAAAPVTTVAHEACEKYFKEYDPFYHITENVVCAGRTCENDICEVNASPMFTCEGDSGGPLVYEHKLIGLVSYGWSCANYDPGVYTYIYKHKDFIANATERTLGVEKVTVAARKVKDPKTATSHQPIVITTDQKDKNPLFA